MQPHLQRTKLCEMKDNELEPLYVKKRDELKSVVSSIIKPKIVQGKTLNGKEFVSFLEQVLPSTSVFFIVYLSLRFYETCVGSSYILIHFLYLVKCLSTFFLI